MAKLDTEFYYDRELGNRATSIRILDPENTVKNGKKDGNPLIARAILTQGYGYNITNSWEKQSSFIDTIINMVGGMVTSSTGKLAMETVGTLGDALGSDSMISFAQEGSKYTNSHIFSAGQLMKAFNGTEVDLKGAEEVKLKFISDKQGNDVISQINRLQSYAIGSRLEVPKALSDWVGVQGSPNDYEWRITNTSFDKPVPKTLTMFVGNFMVLENLLISSLDVDMSPQTVMISAGSNPTYGDSRFIKGQPSKFPLYADVTVKFTFARMITSFDLTKIFVNLRGGSDFTEPENYVL